MSIIKVQLNWVQTIGFFLIFVFGCEILKTEVYGMFLYYSYMQFIVNILFLKLNFKDLVLTKQPTKKGCMVGTF